MLSTLPLDHYAIAATSPPEAKPRRCPYCRAAIADWPGHMMAAGPCRRRHAAPHRLFRPPGAAVSVIMGTIFEEGQGSNRSLFAVSVNGHLVTLADRSRRPEEYTGRKKEVLEAERKASCFLVG